MKSVVILGLLYLGVFSSDKTVAKQPASLFLCDSINKIGLSEPSVAHCIDTLNLENNDTACITALPGITDSIPVIAKREENKKLIAAVLAFPLPFGLLGLHRIYLGTKPYMPFVYLGTIGGCFGILPILDFIAILRSNKENLKNYENNPKVFMWLH